MSSTAVRRISTGVNPNVRKQSSIFLPDVSELEESGTYINYGQTFQKHTQEALPKLDNYRNIMSVQAAQRPTLDELHGDGVKRQRSVRSKSCNVSFLIFKFGNWIRKLLKYALIVAVQLSLVGLKDVSSDAC